MPTNKDEITLGKAENSEKKKDWGDEEVLD